MAHNHAVFTPFLLIMIASLVTTSSSLINATVITELHSFWTNHSILKNFLPKHKSPTKEALLIGFIYNTRWSIIVKLQASISMSLYPSITIQFIQMTEIDSFIRWILKCSRFTFGIQSLWHSDGDKLRDIYKSMTNSTEYCQSQTASNDSVVSSEQRYAAGGLHRDDYV